MAGYAKRFVHLPFPELAEEGDEIWVTIRNPKLAAPQELVSEDVEVKEDGTPVDPGAAMQATFATVAKLMHSWHVYDATDTGDEQELLPSPATPELVAKLPIEIINRIGEVLTEATNPR